MWVCRLPVHIAPRRMQLFTVILRKFVTSHRADRVVGPYGEISMHSYPVGADDSVRPQNAPVLRKAGAHTYVPACFDVGADAYIGPLGSCKFAADYRKNGAHCAGRCVPASGRPTSVTLLRRERL